MKIYFKILPSLMLATCSYANADIITDGSMGTAQTLSGSAYQIPQNLGTTVGGNLFHSFSQFSLQQGESATFTGDNALKNVISRVTGGNVSVIDGLLQSTIGTANFYFINPAGITFGANAQVDVPAAFHLSSANNLRFADGSQFSAALSSPSTLSIAEPVGFGFLANQGTLQIQQSQLSFNAANAVSLSGNQVVIEGGVLTNPAGSLQLYSAGESNNTIDLTHKTMTGLAGQTTLNNSTLDVSGNGAGLLTLHSGTIDINNSLLSSDNQGTVNADGNQGIKVAATNLNLSNGALLRSAAKDAGQGANIAIQAGAVFVDGQATKTGLETSANGTGQAGDINLISEQLEVYYGGVIRSDTFAVGNAGNITLSAAQAKINGLGEAIDTGVLTTTDNGATGNAGAITLKSNDLSLSNMAAISSQSKSAGNAGDVTVAATQLLLDGQGNGAEISSHAADINTGATAQAGNVTVTGDTLTLLNGGVIRSYVSTLTNAGNITLQANNVLLDAQAGVVTGILSTNTNNSWANDNAGNSGAITVTANKLSLLNGAEISSKTWSRGDAGKIQISAGDILIDPLQTPADKTATFSDGTGIFSDAQGFSTGKASTIDVQATKLTVLNGGKISSDALLDSTGAAGTVTVKTTDLNLVNAGTISSSTKSVGNAGNVSVQANTISIDGKNNPLYTGIFSDAYRLSSGNAGEVGITTQALTLLNGGEISTSIWNTGNAGNVAIAAKAVLLDGQVGTKATGISSNAQFDSSGHAGTIGLTTDTLTMRDGGQIRSDSMGQGDAGNVTIAAKQVLINRQSNALDTGIFTDTTLLAGTGKAGTINLSSDLITLKSGAEISSNTDNQGNAGSILISAKQIEIDGESNQAIAGIFSDASHLSNGGNGGFVTLKSDNLLVHNGGIISSNSYAAGNAGTVAVQSGFLTLQNTGKISSSTFAQGRAGDVSVTAGNIAITGQNTGIFAAADQASTGQTGHVHVTAQQGINLSKGGALSIQNAGTASHPLITPSGVLTVESPVIQLDNGIITAATAGNVSAGTVNVAATQALVAQNNSSMTSSTSAAGAAGAIGVIAPLISLNNANISSEATAQSAGQTSDIFVSASQALFLANHSRISMQNDATVAPPALITPTSLAVSAPAIDLKNSQITTQSTGNVNAGDIGVNFSGWLTMDPSFITTAANTGNGGTITLRGGQGIYLQDSGFMTSASGATSNGGNINVTADVVVMKTGVIQANAVGGTGGNITLNLKALIPSQNQLIKGGKQVAWQPFKEGLNVVQAASENGVSGDINLTAPKFDISGSISGLNANALALPPIAQDNCSAGAKKVSSLVHGGKGGIPVSEKQTGFVPAALGKPVLATATAKAKSTLALQTAMVLENKTVCHP